MGDPSFRRALLQLAYNHLGGWVCDGIETDTRNRICTACRFNGQPPPPLLMCHLIWKVGNHLLMWLQTNECVSCEAEEVNILRGESRVEWMGVELMTIRVWAAMQLSLLWLWNNNHPTHRLSHIKSTRYVESCRVDEYSGLVKNNQQSYYHLNFYGCSESIGERGGEKLQLHFHFSALCSFYEYESQ